MRGGPDHGPASSSGRRAARSRGAKASAPAATSPVDHRETYFALRDVVHEVDVSGQTEIEAYEDQPHRWWSAEEIRGSDETFAPAGLADALETLITGPWSGPPRIVD